MRIGYFVGLPLLLAALTGCGPSPLCITDQRMEFMGVYPSGDPPDIPVSCDRLSHVASGMMDMMNTGVNPAGYRIWYHNTRKWIDAWDRSVAGFTDCPSKTIHIGTAEQVFAHEVAHALQNCNPELPVDEGSNPEHADWIRKNIFTYIEVASQ